MNRNVLLIRFEFDFPGHRCSTSVLFGWPYKWCLARKRLRVADEVTVAIDPHIHSENSYDGHESVELLLEQAADIGLDSTMLTDHDEIR